MQTNNRLYQLDYHSAPWSKVRYTIKNKNICNTPLYQVRRSGFRKYRQFEDVNNKILFHIGLTTIKSVDNENILAAMQIDGKTVRTMIGNFTLTNLNISQRSYILKFNDNVVAEVKRKWRSIHNRFIIDMQDINEHHQQEFIFALIVLINSILEMMQSPTNASHPIYAPLFSFGSTPAYSSNNSCCSSGMC